jgi:hypothetical protein
MCAIEKISIEHNFSKMMDLLAAANRQAPRPGVYCGLWTGLAVGIALQVLQ